MERAKIDGTIKASAVIGVTPGYFNAGENDINLDEFGRLYQEIADVIFTQTNTYCGAVIVPCRILYRTEWGCPPGGENGIHIVSDFNPVYDKQRSVAEFTVAWKESFLRIIETLMLKLEQKTVTVTFSDGALFYLTNLADY